jgi:hypothetical protein
MTTDTAKLALPPVRLSSVHVIRNLRKPSIELPGLDLEVVLGISESGEEYYFFPGLLAQDLFAAPARGALATTPELIFAPHRARVYAGTKNVQEVLAYMDVKSLGTPLSLRMFETWVSLRDKGVNKYPMKLINVWSEQLNVYRLARRLFTGGGVVGVTLLGHCWHWGRQVKAPDIAAILDPGPRAKPVFAEANHGPVTPAEKLVGPKPAEAPQEHPVVPAAPDTKEKDMHAPATEKRFTAGDLLRRVADAEAPIAVKLVYEQTYMLFLAGRMTLDVALDLRSIAIRQATGLDLTINPNLSYGVEAPSTHTPLVPEGVSPKSPSSILVVSENKPLTLPQAVVVIPKTDDTNHVSAGTIGKPFEVASLLVNDMARELGVIGNPRFGKPDTVFKGTGDAIKNSAGDPATYWLYNLEGQRIMAIACKELAALLADETRREKMGRRDCAKKVAEGLHHLLKATAAE